MADNVEFHSQLRNRVSCPHCWHKFPPQDALWISQHPDLLGDPRLGTDQQLRFLPSRFTTAGAALDSRGFPCFAMACPHCHLSVPRSLFEMEPLFFSILGAPSCGKSYFLASMVWSLRKVLPKHFLLAFGDSDPILNQQLNDYEEQQFLNPNQDELVAIRKTEVQGDLYDTVLYGDQAVRYPRPFIFSMNPLDKHPSSANRGRLSRALCMYDNAGESFLPGADSGSSPVTRHLIHARALLFLFDPTQDLRFRRACQGKTEDPQMTSRASRLTREVAVRQDTILLESAQRIRQFAGLAQGVKHKRPLIVVVTKHDSWSGLSNTSIDQSPWLQGRGTTICGLNIYAIEKLSCQIRDLLWELTPEIVSAAESFSEHVIYIPVSAMGRAPEVDPATGALGIRPRDIHPQWTEVPLLYYLARWQTGIVPFVSAEYHASLQGASSRPSPPFVAAMEPPAEGSTS
jgi:hypothetical protein